MNMLRNQARGGMPAEGTHVRRIVGTCLFATVLAACQQGPSTPAFTPQPERGGKPIALFSNGGFETGDLSNWTVATNLNKGITYPPASIADLNLKPGGTAFTYARNGATPESQIPAGMSAGSTLRYPKYGAYSTVINE